MEDPRMRCPLPKWMLVSPEMADKWLTDTCNRVVRQKHVNELAADMAAGMWKPSHQGIVISNDKCVDGQHRLLALRAAKQSVWMLVFSWPWVEHALDLEADRMARRTVADMTNEPKEVISTVAFILRIHSGHASFTTSQLEPYWQAFGALAKELYAACSMNVRLRSSQQVRAAAVVACVNTGMKDSILAQYRAFVMGDNSRAKALESLSVWVERHPKATTLIPEFFARAFLAFCNQNLSKDMHYTQHEGVMSTARDTIQIELDTTPSTGKPCAGHFRAD